MAYVNTLLLILCWFLIFEFGSTRGDITATRFLRDNETLESSNGMFKFGFFSPTNSMNRYVGIWYNKVVADELQVVWVSNRENPLNDSSGVLRISGDGNLQLLDGQNKSIWSSNITAKFETNATVAQLLDTGNLVLTASGDIIWQSFEYPSNSLLASMKLTASDGNTSTEVLLSSWKSASNPSIGDYIAGLNQRGLVEFFIWDGDQPYWRSGPWDGRLFMGIRAMYYSAQKVGFRLENDSRGTLSLSYSPTSQRATEHYALSYDGIMSQKDWDDDTGNWTVAWQSLVFECDIYGKCGEFGMCNSNKSPICGCLRGFEPRNKQEWNARNWTEGCVRRTPLQCDTVGGKQDGFVRLRNMKLPDNATWYDSDGEEDCRRQCLGNCSCLAYAYDFGFGCMIWSGSLIDIQDFFTVGVDLFVRLAHSELAGKNSKWKVIVAATVTIGVAVLLAFLYILRRWLYRRYANKVATNKEAHWHNHNMVGTRKGHDEFQDLPLLKFEDLVAATNNFSGSNKLGQGGFGPVYKGIFEDGQEVAVKRLSRASGQGLQEFMNEVVVISKLQHKNLVRLLGCCVEGEEKLLVYEYMPNKSLDDLLFDVSERVHLDWKRRFNIIKGISRGLLYLHRDSRLRIIHRDLKASNILLDKVLNPKISDFGMARIFGGDQDHDDTKRIVGTYGYMPPEYAMEGRFSEKSDVFSFGVLLLEIVSGRKNSSFKGEETLSLLGHAWKLWNEDGILSLIDPVISELTSQAEMLRCIQVGLLSVQEFPEDRPSITTVISMIESEVIDLPRPTQPGFIERRGALLNEAERNGDARYSNNCVSISSLGGR